MNLIEGYKDGKDYKIACAMVERYASDHDWSKSKKKIIRGVHFDYEFTMSRNGKNDSNSPSESISVCYYGGRKGVEIKRRGKWSAIVALDDDGGICGGQFQDGQGINDLVMLKELHGNVLREIIGRKNL